MMIWNDLKVAYIAQGLLRRAHCKPCCGVVDYVHHVSFSAENCFGESHSSHVPTFHLCEKPAGRGSSQLKKRLLSLPRLGKHVSEAIPTAVVCRSGHFTHCFLAVDERSSCWEQGDIFDRRTVHLQQDPAMSKCFEIMTTLPAHFQCVRSLVHLPYTLVCDQRQDCSDNSDEGFCTFPSCTNTAQPCTASLRHDMKVCYFTFDFLFYLSFPLSVVFVSPFVYPRVDL